MKSEIKLKTNTGKTISPITLFAQYKNGRKQTLRGDRFTKEPNRMIILLFQHVDRILDQTTLIIIYDNRISGENGQNIIMKWYREDLEIDRTATNYEIQNIDSFRIERKRRIPGKPRNR